MNSPAPAPRSLATAQRSLLDPSVRHPLWPPLTEGCPVTSTDEIAYPLDIDYAYDEVPAELFTRPAAHGLDRWAPLLPPLAAPGLGEGNTPLIELPDGIWIKDESRNPTWSHKDRLNRVTVSAAVASGARGIVVSSSGNHGAAAAAYAARAGLPCAVFTSPHAPPAVASHLRAYGATVLTVPYESVRPLMRRIVHELGFQAVSSVTDTAHTGHPFGPEGYKTLAYEIALDLGRAPAAVHLPTGYGELLFGVAKGFQELARLGVTDSVPRMYATEPAAAGALTEALRTGSPAVRVPVRPTVAYAIDCEITSYRGILAVRTTGGASRTVTDDDMLRARRELASLGLWCETSAAAGLAGLRTHGPQETEGPVVCVVTSSGYKDVTTASGTFEPTPPDWPSIKAALSAEPGH
ncbi:pyridoxal-phosphate dependent enzyme [Streptomyces sp. NBC_00094]|uniref:threonine synthase n=1 Tax=Streptomyces sp. NBC_00094 TaxID=2903620 RepID=UPI0022568630|nr:pyridoxal-phosphate dependent enzyme [Streptomyces sp. NBC_00094]MCX5388703.1 pyridoxal-phosphate dependent enzyme [Streptomyces sp. NBC_00094]